MSHLIEQKENKKKLLIDPLSKFHSSINKDLIDYENHLDSRLRKHLPLAPTLFQQQTTPNLSNQSRNIKFGILDANFNDLLSFSQVGGDHQKGKKRSEKSLKKEQAFQAAHHRVQKSITLPKLSSSNLRLSKANFLNGQETLNGCTLLSEMIDKLEQSHLLTSHGDKICTDKNTLHQLLSYIMCLALADKKNEVCNLKYTYEQFTILDTIAQKLFFKIRQKKLSRKKPKLKLCPQTVSFRCAPAVTCQKRKARVKTRLSSQQMEKDQSEPQTKIKITSSQWESYIADQRLLEQFERAKELYSDLKSSLQEYTEILSSGDLKVKLGEMYPLEKIQKELTSEIKLYYLTVFHDPMLVPDLKEKLLINLVAKVLNTFKFSIYDFSQTAEQKCRSVSLIVQQIRDWIQKHQLKQEYLARMKKLFIIDITLFLRKVAHLDNRLMHLSSENSSIVGSHGQIQRSKLQQLLRFGEQMVEFCRRVSHKYKSQQVLSN